MRHTVRHILIALLFGTLTLAALGLWSSPILAAVLTTQTVSGITDFTDETVQDWKPLEVEGTVGAGNIVRTDFDALADLLGDDGSFLEIAEATQLTVLEYDFDAAQEIRIARFAILEGTVTAEAVHLEYPTNIFDVETPTVTASFKFSKATITYRKADGSTFVETKDGKFLLSREGKQPGPVKVSHTTTDKSTGQEVETTFQIPENGKVEVEITDTGLKIANLGNTPIQVNVGGKTITLPPNGAISIEIKDGKVTVTNNSLAAANAAQPPRDIQPPPIVEVDGQKIVDTESTTFDLPGAAAREALQALQEAVKQARDVAEKRPPNPEEAAKARQKLGKAVEAFKKEEASLPQSLKSMADIQLVQANALTTTLQTLSQQQLEQQQTQAKSTPELCCEACERTGQQDYTPDAVATAILDAVSPGNKEAVEEALAGFRPPTDEQKAAQAALEALQEAVKQAQDIAAKGQGATPEEIAKANQALKQAAGNLRAKEPSLPESSKPEARNQAARVNALTAMLRAQQRAAQQARAQQEMSVPELCCEACTQTGQPDDTPTEVADAVVSAVSPANQDAVKGALAKLFEERGKTGDKLAQEVMEQLQQFNRNTGSFSIPGGGIGAPPGGGRRPGGAAAAAGGSSTVSISIEISRE